MYACISCSNEYQGVKPLTTTYHIVYNSEFCLELKRSYFSQSIFFFILGTKIGHQLHASILIKTEKPY